MLLHRWWLRRHRRRWRIALLLLLLLHRRRRTSGVTRRRSHLLWRRRHHGLLPHTWRWWRHLLKALIHTTTTVLRRARSGRIGALHRGVVVFHLARSERRHRRRFRHLRFASTTSSVRIVCVCTTTRCSRHGGRGVKTRIRRALRRQVRRRRHGRRRAVKARVRIRRRWWHRRSRHLSRSWWRRKLRWRRRRCGRVARWRLKRLLLLRRRRRSGEGCVHHRVHGRYPTTAAVGGRLHRWRLTRIPVRTRLLVVPSSASTTRRFRLRGRAIDSFSQQRNVRVFSTVNSSAWRHIQKRQR